MLRDPLVADRAHVFRVLAFAPRREERHDGAGKSQTQHDP